ncbi:MAG: ABC transporter substrate-binding protein [Candidatus Tectomicrobia bacterium]|nr:ABC transporter substrate-binding protein [Candidatus Tectomicrobia bacterium]
MRHTTWLRRTITCGVMLGLLLGMGLAARAQGLVDVRVYVLQGTQMFPVEIMQRQKIAEKHGLRIIRRDVVSVSALYTALTGNEVDISFPAWASNVLFRSQGMKLVTVFPLIGFVNDILVRKDSPIQTFADLKGKRLGVFGGPAGTTSMVFRTIGKKYFGFDPLIDASLRYGSPVLQANLLEKGELDAVLTLHPLTSKFLTTKPFRSIMDIGKFWKEKTGQDMLLVTITTNEDFIAKHPEAVRGFVAAYKEAVGYINSHPEVWKDFAKIVGIEDEAGREMLQKALTGQYLTTWNQSSLDDLRGFTDEVQKLFCSAEVGGEKGKVSASACKGFPPRFLPDTFSFAFVPK